NLSATVVADPAAPGSAVNQGTVTFTVKNGASVVGAAVGDTTVVNGAASVTYPLPAGLAAGTYTIEAAYGGTTHLVARPATGDNGKTHTVNKATTPVPPATASVVY